MLTAFGYTIKILVRNKGNLLWAIAFPLILSTLFYSMFHKLDDIYKIDPIPIIVVNDTNYQNAEPYKVLIDALSDEDSEDSILAPVFVQSEQEALAKLAGGGFYGYLMLDKQGSPEYYMDARLVSGFDMMNSLKQGVVLSINDRYIQDYELISQAVQTRPELFYDSDFIESFYSEMVIVEQGSITMNPPSDALRYYYAALAFSCVQMMSFGLTAITSWRANASALGSRRAIGGQSWRFSLAPTLLAAWFLSFCCVLIGFLYIRFGFGASFGGKEPACLIVLAASTLLTTLVGALVGSTSLPNGAKTGIAAAFACILSIFAGLYGPATQQLGDYAAREMPLLSNLNPARQVADAFFSLYYYDGYSRLIELLGLMLGMAFILFIGCILIMRKQRYKSL
jgi:ABC-type multidrug transport system permease subunit